ncbi:hypothetical protein [Pandoraea faecigallinarum]|nr:hypothetical protein [Pandoraea faecigallinarum]
MKKVLLVVLMIALLSQQTASSFVPPPAASWLFNRSIASIMREVAKRRGIAAADPRIAATEAAMSSELTALNVAGTGVGIGLSVLGAPVWLTILAGLGIVAGGSAIVAYLGKDKIRISADERDRVRIQVPRDQQPGVEKASYPGLSGSGFEDHWSVAAANAGFRVYRRRGCMPGPCARFPLESDSIGTYQGENISVHFAGMSDVVRFIRFMSDRFDGENAFTAVRFQPAFDVDGNLVQIAFEVTRNIVENKCRPCKLGKPGKPDKPDGSLCYEMLGVPVKPDEAWCPEQVRRTETEVLGQYDLRWPGGSFFALQSVYEREQPSTAQNWYDSLERAYVGIPKNIHGARIGSETLAKVADSAWRRAASRPDYEGLPYSATDPVTTADVDPWAKANPEAVPLIEDLFRPANRPRERKVIIRETIKPETQTGTETETKVDPTTGPKTETDTKTKPESQLTKDVNVVNRPTVDIGSPVKVDLGTAPQVATPTLEDPPTAAMILDPILKLAPGFKDWKTPKYKAQCPRPSFELFNKRIRMDAMCDLAEKYRPMITAIMLAVFVLIAAAIVLAA